MLLSLGQLEKAFSAVEELWVTFTDEVKMDELQGKWLSKSRSSNNSFVFPNLTSFNVHSFVSNLSKKVSVLVELQKRKDYGTKLDFFSRNNKKSSIVDLSLEEQLRPWKENPAWVDHPPNIKVTVPKGSLCNLFSEVTVGLPPEAAYNIVTDPDNKRVFKNIKEVISRKVLVDEGSRQVVEVEQAAIWRFLWWSGTISVHVLVEQNREDYTMKFKQLKSGFMERFEGCWKVEPIFVDEELCHPFKPKSVTDYVMCTKGRGRLGSKLSLQQLIQPSIVPPAPISWYLRGITAKTTEMLINDLLAEAARIRQEISSSETSHLSGEKYTECQVGDAHNIKQRWALRRKNTRHHRRKLSLTSNFCRIR